MHLPTLQRAWKIVILLIIKLLLSLVFLDKIISYFIFFRYHSTEPWASCNAEEFNRWKNTIAPSILAVNFVQLVVLQIIWRYGEKIASRLLRSVLKLKEINHVPPGTYVAERGVLEIGPHSWQYINKEAQETSHHAHQHTDRETPETGLHTRSDINKDAHNTSGRARPKMNPEKQKTSDNTRDQFKQDTRKKSDHVMHRVESEPQKPSDNVGQHIDTDMQRTRHDVQRGLINTGVQEAIHQTQRGIGYTAVQTRNPYASQYVNEASQIDKISVVAETDPGPSLSANVDRTSKWVNTISHSLVPATSGRSVLRSRQVATKNREPSPSPPQELRTPVNASTDLIRIPGFLHQPASNPHVLADFSFAKDLERPIRLSDRYQESDDEGSRLPTPISTRRRPPVSTLNRDPSLSEKLVRTVPSSPDTSSEPLNASSTRFEPAIDSQDEAAESITDSVIVPHSIEASVRNVSPGPSARPMTTSRPISLVATTPTTTQEQSLTNLRAEISAWQSHDDGVPRDLASRLRLKKQKQSHSGLSTPLHDPSWVRKKQRVLEHLCRQRNTFKSDNIIEVYGLKESWQYDILVCWLHGNLHIWTRELRWPPGYVDLDLDNKEEEEGAEGGDLKSVFTFATDTSE